MKLLHLYRISRNCLLSLAIVFGIYVRAGFAPGLPSPAEMPSPEELQRMVEDIEKNDPELFKLLQEEGRRIMIEAGIDPDSFDQQKPDTIHEEKPADSTPKDTSAPTSVKQENKAPVGPIVRNVQEVELLLETLLHSLNNIRLKAHANGDVARLLERFKKELDDLFYYLPVIKNKPISTYLATADFTPLYTSLKTFSKKLALLEPQLIVEDIYAEKHETPYQILGVRPGSSLKKIRATFEQRMRAKDPKKLKKQLEEGDFSQKEKKNIVQANELQRKTLQEAYDTLSDPHTKKRLDREHTLRVEQGLLGGRVSKELLSSIGKTFTDFIYHERILESIKKLVARYAPEAAEKKSKMEEDIKQERQRLEEAKKKVSPPSPLAPRSGGTYYPPAHNAYYGGGYPGGGYPSYYGDYSPRGEAGGMQPRAGSDKEGSSGKPSRGGKGGDKDKEKEKKESSDKEKSKESKEDTKDTKKDKKEDKEKKRSKKSDKKFSEHIAELVKALHRTANTLTTQSVDEIKGRDQAQAKKLHADLELDIFIEKLTDLYNALTGPKGDGLFPSDKEKKEAAQQWKSSVLLRSQQPLQRLMTLATLPDDLDPEAEISQQEQLAKEVDDLRDLMKKISKELGLKPVTRGPGTSHTPHDLILRLINEPARTETLAGHLIDVRKALDAAHASFVVKKSSPSLDRLIKPLESLSKYIKLQVPQDDRAALALQWQKKILSGSTEPLLKALDALQTKDRSVIDQEDGDITDQRDTVFALLKTISQDFGLISPTNEPVGNENKAIFDLLLKPRRIAGAA